VRVKVHDSADTRVPLLDGIRGVAILLVLWAHFVPDIAIPIRALEWFRKTTTAGWTGVDLFFVLSGFLITGILLDTKASTHYFRNFYGRRFLRIFPLYYMALVFALVILPTLHSENDAQLARAAPWLWSYCANIGWMLQAPLRAPWPTDGIDLRGFWSLSIEEHFYLLWPFIIARASLRQLKLLCIAFFCFSLFARCFWIATFSADTLIVVQTAFRLDPLLAGAFLAISMRDGSARRLIPWARWVAIASAGTLTVFFFVMKGLWSGHWLMETIGVSVVALFFASSILLAIGSRSEWPSRVLGTTALRFFGKYSYGLYITHGFVIMGLGNWVSQAFWLDTTRSPVLAIINIVVIKSVASLAGATLSWHLLEKHFIGLKNYFGQTRVIPIARTSTVGIGYNPPT
jgi:peptidoglycan/LPS O-acetylase OafA/YrhL